MDPNVAYENLMEIADLVVEAQDADYSFRAEVANEKLREMAEAAQALDGWLKSGGFLPREWAVGRK